MKHSHHGFKKNSYEILEAAKIYVESLDEFMKFYRDYNDDHFVYAGLKNEANVMNQSATLFQ